MANTLSSIRIDCEDPMTGDVSGYIVVPYEYEESEPSVNYQGGFVFDLDNVEQFGNVDPQWLAATLADEAMLENEAIMAQEMEQSRSQGQQEDVWDAEREEKRLGQRFRPPTRSEDDFIALEDEMGNCINVHFTATPGERGSYDHPGSGPEFDIGKIEIDPDTDPAFISMMVAPNPSRPGDYVLTPAGDEAFNDATSDWAANMSERDDEEMGQRRRTSPRRFY